MPVADDTTATDTGWLRARVSQRREALALVVVWSMREPHRIGEIAFLPRGGGPRVLGRGAADGEERRVVLVRQRPGRAVATPPLRSRGISRRQLRIHAGDRRLRVENLGRGELRVNGHPAQCAEVVEGDTVLLDHRLLLLCVRRPVELDGPAPDAGHRFGEADAHGIVGESAAAWRLRQTLADVARTERHVLIVSPSGTGKELAAQAVHTGSARASRELLSRNAATFPPGLIDAELFGSVRDYPHAGAPEREGLIGRADGGTLFLDEIGELPASLQTHLLRVLDAGEYHRLGSSQARRADLRLVAATSREGHALIPELRARLTLRVRVPSLAERREDIALIARHLLCRAARQDPDLVRRFFDGWDGAGGQPRISPELVERLVRHDFSTHVRELDGLLWEALLHSRGGHIEAPAEQPDEPPPPAAAPDEATVRAVLAAHGGNVTLAAARLGVTSRFAMYRLMRRYRIEPDAYRHAEV